MFPRTFRRFFKSPPIIIMQRDKAKDSSHRTVPNPPRPAAGFPTPHDPRLPTPPRPRPQSQPIPDYVAASAAYQNRAPATPASAFIPPPQGYFASQFHSAQKQTAPQATPAQAPAKMPQNGNAQASSAMPGSHPPPSPTLPYNNTHYYFCEDCGYGYRSGIVQCICEASHKKKSW